MFTHFNNNIVFIIQYPILFTEGASIDKDKYDKLQEVLGWAKGFIAETGYVAGTKGITLADICFVATLATVQASGYLKDDIFETIHKTFCNILFHKINY